MSKDMKLIMENWRDYNINEGLLSNLKKIWNKATDKRGVKAAQKEMEKMAKVNKLKTVGELIDMIKVFQSLERANKGFKMLDDLATAQVMGIIMKMIPADAQTSYSLMKYLATTYLLKKPVKKPQDKLKFFRIDPDLAAIVDNDVEEEFMNWFLQNAASDSSIGAMKLQNLNMNAILRDYLKMEFGGRTVAMKGLEQK